MAQISASSTFAVAHLAALGGFRIIANRCRRSLFEKGLGGCEDRNESGGESLGSFLELGWISSASLSWAFHLFGFSGQ